MPPYCSGVRAGLISENAQDTMALDYIEVTPGMGGGGSTGMIRLKLTVAKRAGGSSTTLR